MNEIQPASPNKGKSPASRKTRTKARKRAREEYVSHVIRVREWELYYSRRATDPKSKWERGPVDDFATLTLVGEIVRPEKCKYRAGKLTFCGRTDLPDPEPATTRRPIGSAMARGEEVEGYLFVPEERLRLLLTAAQSGRIEFAHFTGPKLRYGGGMIHSVSLGTHFDEDEW